VTAADQGVGVFVVTLADRKVTPIAKSTNGYSVFFSGDGKALVCNGEDQAAGQASWSPGSVEPRR